MENGFQKALKRLWILLVYGPATSFMAYWLWQTVFFDGEYRNPPILFGAIDTSLFEVSRWIFLIGTGAVIGRKWPKS